MDDIGEDVRAIAQTLNRFFSIVEDLLASAKEEVAKEQARYSGNVPDAERPANVE